MICVTGAGGTVGGEVMEQLKEKRAPFRAAFHSKEKADAARVRGIESVVIDYARPETLEEAFRGCDRLFLIGPSVPNQTGFELNAVQAAKAAGVRHVVKLSVLKANEESYDFANIHRPVEKAIETSGMKWTFLRSNSFMQNVVNYMGNTIRADGTFYSATGTAKISHVDVRDIAATAVQALIQPGHEGKSYNVTGPEALTYDEMARELSKSLGRSIRHISISPADLEKGMLAEGMPREVVRWLIDLERFYRENKASCISHDIERVTGREPRRFAEYVHDYASSLQPA
jgi:uncharacterized protein YbjT (DUF2867 family)